MAAVGRRASREDELRERDSGLAPGKPGETVVAAGTTSARVPAPDDRRRAARAPSSTSSSQRGHTPVPSASLIPHDKTVLFTVAGMVPFKPYFVGEETPPYPRATSIQKCVRAGGKHNDLDDIGRTNRHFTFFEMLGNFSFGDYFKAEAIRGRGSSTPRSSASTPSGSGSRSTSTDDEAETIWRDEVGVPAERIQRLGDDNFWRMADTGPCGPSSEIFWDLGPEFGADGGPGRRRGPLRRDLEPRVHAVRRAGPTARWCRCRSRASTPAPGSSATSRCSRASTRSGTSTCSVRSSPRRSRSPASTYQGVPRRRVGRLAAHPRRARPHDDVPRRRRRGAEQRGARLRAAPHHPPRRAPRVPARRRARSSRPRWSTRPSTSMGGAYPELVAQHDLVRDGGPARGGALPPDPAARRGPARRACSTRGDVTGERRVLPPRHPRLPDRPHPRDRGGARSRASTSTASTRAMEEQRTRAREAHKAAGGSGRGAPVELYRELLDELGPTDFTGRQEYETDRRQGARRSSAGGERLAQAERRHEPSTWSLDRTPFYAESGGQVGDTGVIETARPARACRRRRHPVRRSRPGSRCTGARSSRATIAEGDEAVARIDGARRDAIRRNHTATHLLHWALREVLGPHVKQAGSFVGPDRLRFDFSHYEAVSPRAARPHRGARQRAGDHRRRAGPPLRDHQGARREHRRDRVLRRQVRRHRARARGGASTRSSCAAAPTCTRSAFIGPIKIVSEGSIGSNLRRIEAVTGDRRARPGSRTRRSQLRDLAEPARASRRPSCRRAGRRSCWRR